SPQPSSDRHRSLIGGLIDVVATTSENGTTSSAPIRRLIAPPESFASPTAPAVRSASRSGRFRAVGTKVISIADAPVPHPVRNASNAAFSTYFLATRHES